jgi:hypothetical protein
VTNGPSITLALEDKGEGFLEIGFGFFQGVAFGDGGGDFFDPAGVAALGCGFVDGGEVQGEDVLPGGGDGLE